MHNPVVSSPRYITYCSPQCSSTRKRPRVDRSGIPFRGYPMFGALNQSRGKKHSIPLWITHCITMIAPIQQVPSYPPTCCLCSFRKLAFVPSKNNGPRIIIFGTPTSWIGVLPTQGHRYNQLQRYALPTPAPARGG